MSKRCKFKRNFLIIFLVLFFIQIEQINEVFAQNERVERDSILESRTNEENIPKLRVAIDPTQVYSVSNNQDYFVLKDFMQLISYNSRVVFEYVYFDDYDEYISSIKDGKADILSTVYNGDVHLDEKDVVLSEVYFNAPMVLVSKEDFILNSQKTYKIGVVSYEKSIVKELEKLFNQGYEIVEYKNMEDCISEFFSGEIDLILDKYYIVNTSINLYSGKQYKILTVLDNKFKMALGTSKSLPTPILNKLNDGISKIDAETRNYIVVKNNLSINDTDIDQKINKNNKSLIIFLSIMVLGIILIIYSYRRKNIKALYKAAYVDLVTFGGNFSKFKEEAEDKLKKDIDGLSILFMNLSKFKTINNLYGFMTGDEVLRHLYKIMDEIKTSDDLVCRENGDKFVVLFKDKPGFNAIDFYKKIIQEIDKTYKEKQTLKLILNCGICRVTDKSESISYYIDKARIALQNLGNTHSSKYIIYSEDMSESINKEKQIENIMEIALKNGEFRTYFQPKIELSTDTIVGVEALVRWIRPDGEVIYPDEFIPLFEKNGFIENVDLYTFENCCKYIKNRVDRGEEVYNISVNQSKKVLDKVGYVDKIRGILDKYSIPEGTIDIEIPENLFFENIEEFVIIINELKELGIKINMDDFGSGYSSLNVLKELPLDIIKMDRVFLTSPNNSNTSKIIIKKTVELAYDLKMSIVCEGVETKEQTEFLKDINCDYAQGYFYSRPISMDEFDKFVLNYKNKLN